MQSDIGLLILRLAFGLTMAFGHGLGKLPPSDQLIQGVAGMGFPLPFVFAWCAALAEFLGSLCVAAGLKIRFAAASVAFTMGIAFFVAHAGDPFGKKEMAFLYLAASIALMFLGAGRFSVDQVLRRHGK